jgi:hypothetical protein
VEDRLVLQLPQQTSLRRGTGKRYFFLEMVVDDERLGKVRPDQVRSG